MKSLKILTLLMFLLVLKAEAGLKKKHLATGHVQGMGAGQESSMVPYPTPVIPPDEILPVILCPTVRTCGKIYSVKTIESYRITCALQNGREVDCTTLYKKYGPEIQDLKVEIIEKYLRYEDKCHIPGGCGHRACERPWLGLASISQQCQ